MRRATWWPRSGRGLAAFSVRILPREQLLKSLERHRLRPLVIQRECHLRPSAPDLAHDTSEAQGLGQSQGLAADRNALDAAQTPAESSADEITHRLSRRELLILRMLTEGASNKVIALKMVITELTVKVHMKAILRKLRLQNRTQAAMWARNHVHEAVWARLSKLAPRVGQGHRDTLEALHALAC